MDIKLVLMGCGKMGGAMLEGWLERGLKPADITVVDIDPKVVAALGGRGLGVDLHVAPEEIGANVDPDVVVFAVKPQDMDAVAPPYRRFAGPGCVFLSIAAGKTIAYLKDKLGGGDVAIVRSMPNTPAAVRRGITVACPSPLVDAGQRQLCHRLLEAVGEVAWVDDERLIDPVTALSGGGPAYVFLLVECMAKAGVRAGLPADLAERLARVTVSGAGELLRLSAEPPEVLRKNVTSPGGTTAEALKVLMAEDAWQPLLDSAIAEATRRSRELAG